MNLEGKRITVDIHPDLLVLGKSGVNTLTDAHAFAVIAFQTLCLIHPLMGDLVLDGEPELEEKAALLN